VLGSANVVGLQVRGRSEEYGWKTAAEDDEVELQTVLSPHTDAPTLRDRVRGVWRHLERLQPAAIGIAGYASAEMLAALAWCRCRRRIAVLLSESKASDASRSTWREHVKSRVVRSYHAAVVGGGPQRRYLEALDFPSDAIFTGYDVVDNADYHPERVGGLPCPLERPYFFMVNRFVPKKNLKFALDCYAEYRQRLASNETPWDLVLAGDGELRSDLEARVDALQLRSVVHFPGFLQQQELLPYLAHCDVFLHASTVEQWGLVVNEAMAAGRPVFVSRTCGCFEDLIQEGRTGFGFDPTNREELISLMVRASRGELPLAELGVGALAHIDNFTPLHFGLALKQAVEYGSQRISSRPKRR
jgi:1,2-diacylglycerol 3-alpha-glucosyltransferase